MYNIEDNFWWYAGLRDLVFVFVSKLKKSNNNKTNLRLLDAGCGTGGVLIRIEDFQSYGIELSEEAIKFCKKRKLKNVIRASIDRLPFNDNFFDIVISLDVLYHLDVKSDIEALKELYRVTNMNGMLVLNLPSYNFLLSKHDKAIHTRQRYIKSVLGNRVKQSGFEIIRITYRNTIMFPIIFFIRLIKKVQENKNTRSDLKTLSNIFILNNILNNILKNILLFENKLINIVDLPFGLSVFCIATKSKEMEEK